MLFKVFFLGMATMVLLQFTARYGTSKWPTWVSLYRGIPFWRWYGMWHILHGTKILQKTGNGTGVYKQSFNKRLWISPMSDAFKEPEL
jgi:hypothetical protein